MRHASRHSPNLHTPKHWLLLYKELFYLSNLNNWQVNNHPLNLGVRFLLEIALVVIFAYWAWNKFDGIFKYMLSFLLPVIGISIWAIFKVEGDPGKAIVAIPGWLRLILEAILFVSAFYMLRSVNLTKWSLLFLVVTVIHYLASYDRIIWLLKN